MGGSQVKARARSKAERRKRTSSLAAAGGMANVGVIATYQSGLFSAEDLDILECRHEVVKRVGQVHAGNTGHVVGLLMAQALALNSIFTKLAVKAADQDERGSPHQMESYLRLALKAQAQSRATLDALVAIGNPPVLFAQQANVAFGPQQVNNAGSSHASARVGEAQVAPNELLEELHGERLDTRAQGAASGADPNLATLAAVDRTENS